MLFSRSLRKLFGQIIPLLKMTAVGTETCHFPTENQFVNHGKLGIFSCCNKQIKVAIAALTLPVMFVTASEAQVSQTAKAKESTAKQFVAAMNKAQQAYYAENTGFTSSVSNLGLGNIKPDTDNYSYSITTGNKAVFNYGVSQHANLKSFVGGVFLVGNTNTKSILCQTNAAGKAKPANPTNKNGVLSCGANTVKVAG
ncbi:MAG: type IV pilin-like G/H family protein [Microcoleus sp.]